VCRDTILFAFMITFLNKTINYKHTRNINICIYRGAPEVKTLLPAPNAVVHIRDFNGSMMALAKHLKFLLENEEVYEKHREWKRQPVDSWSSTFLTLISNRKEQTFCAVCDYTSQYARKKSSFEEDEQEEEDDDEMMVLGYFTLNVMGDAGLMVEHRVNIPGGYNRERLVSYGREVCMEVRASEEGCGAVINEIIRLQEALTTKVV
jgi:hypothetical protein